MEFHTWHTMYNMLMRSLKSSGDESSRELLRSYKASPDPVKKFYDSLLEFLPHSGDREADLVARGASEAIWYSIQKPYYKIHQPYIKMFGKTSLDIPCEHIGRLDFVRPSKRLNNVYVSRTCLRLADTLLRTRNIRKT